MTTYSLTYLPTADVKIIYHIVKGVNGKWFDGYQTPVSRVYGNDMDT